MPDLRDLQSDSPRPLRGLASGFDPSQQNAMAVPSLQDLLQGGKGKFMELYNNPEIQEILRWLQESRQQMGGTPLSDWTQRPEDTMTMGQMGQRMMMGPGR